MKFARSRKAFRRALQGIPGGVNSPVRSFRAVGGDPPFIREGRGGYLFDIDGNRYIDYVGSWGPLILGHAPRAVTSAVAAALRRGSTFGAPIPDEVRLAELIRSALPSIERIRLVSSGTEACMSALRVARAFTKRDGLIKFEGCYHGHADPFLVKAGSGAATLGTPNSPGVPRAAARQTVVLPYNDSDAFRGTLRKRWREIAAVIVEPVAGNMGVVPPAAGFLETLRRETRRTGTLLIFDEVITGFRVAYGGAQTVLGIEPDLTTLGKIIGGGLPMGAYGGRRDAMSLVAPEGPVYQAGTLSGNPLAVAAGIAQLRALRSDPGLYRRLEKQAFALDEGIRAAARGASTPVRVNRFGSLLTVFFQPGPVTDWASAARSDTDRFGRFFRDMLRRGIYLPPSQYEAWFISAAHTAALIERTVRAARGAFHELMRRGT
ncbi:MAG: glutamate-1-semialdehyde 2,1-aminomutase [Planctomycetes bacterium]|nr:glutamate-1-semialdehyde 2,1-aminomutase [Planctomycetota bacterium]